MTEGEWLACKDIEPMLECLVTTNYPDAEPCNWGRGERKKRLFVYACLSRIWDLLPDEYKQAFRLLEPECDEKVSDEQRRAIWSAADNVSCAHTNLLFAVSYDDIGLLCYIATRIVGEAARDSSEDARQIEARQQQDQRAHESLIRDVFGNPFRPMTLDSAWFTPNVVALAQSIYDERAFDRLPELADALEEAACTDADILAHCRGPGPHVRGCWAVDLLLGKE